MEGLSACECPVCFLILNHTTHEPMSMPCGHTLCKVCVHQLGGRSTNTVTRSGVVTRPTFQCPICRQWINIDAVSLNVTLRDLLSELGRMEEKRIFQLGTALNVLYSEIMIEEVLDRGAFGEVCRGKWSGNDVAVKLFSTGRPTPETMEAFQREVFVMNSLRHPNVVLLLGACQTPPKLAIIMEYVSGGSLHQLIHVNKKILSDIETVQIATDICRGLQYLHSINVLHRDLKSKNVLLTGPIPCQTKLCDFGLSRMRQESATMTGNIGTVHWTAPEVLNNQRYKFSADIYGLGMVVYEMVSRCVPLGHMVPMAVMLAVAIRRERPVIPDNAHPTFQQLIKDCTEWLPEDRPSLPAILTSLTTISSTESVAGSESKDEKRGILQHQDSLGVVFLSATDSTDLINQEFVQHNKTPPTLHLDSLEKTSFNMSMALNPVYQSPAATTTGYSIPYSIIDETNERISYNMAIAQQQKAAPPRKRYLGEGNAPWPRYEEREGEIHSDSTVARDLQTQLNQVQFLADRELAEQLQMKENSFQATDPVTQTRSIFPPEPLLNTIRTKQFPQLKHVETTPTKTTPTNESLPLRKKFGSMFSKAFKNITSSNEEGSTPQSLPTTKKYNMKKKTSKRVNPQVENVKVQSSPIPRSKMSSTSISQGTNHSAVNYQNISGFSRYDDHTAPPVERATVGALSRPIPPPPPPLPISIRGQRLSPRQSLLQDVRKKAPTVARQLRPVQTIEKSAFRVGHVIGGYDQQMELYTTQNMITSFNKHRLRPVTINEPLPPFPVGRVVQSRHHVKRMSSHIESSLTTNDGPHTSIPPPPRRHRLHPAIQSAVEKFSHDKLHHVHTVLKQTLPNMEDLEQEKRSKVIEELLAFDRSLLVTVETVFKDRLPSADVLEIERRQVVDSDLTITKDLVLYSVLTFDPSGLHHVITKVKNTLPSIGTIQLEKKTMTDD